MAAVDFFLKIDGIDGESTDRDHKGEIDVLSFSWGEILQISRGSGGGTGAGKVDIQDIHITKFTDKSSPVLFLSCASGKHIPTAVLSGRNNRTGASGAQFYKITLSDCIISSYQSGGSSGDAVPGDQFSINFAKIEFNGNAFDTSGGTIG